MFYLTGEYNHQLDDKNRIRIPRKLRECVNPNEKFFLSKGTDGCIFVFPETTINAKLEKLSEIKLSDIERQRGLRSFAKSLEAVVEDNQGRTILSPAFRDYAHIKKDIVICGSVDHIEIWAKEVYDEYFSNDSEDFNANFSLLDI